MDVNTANNIQHVKMWTGNAELAKPFVDEEGIYVPYDENPIYYQCLITRELFVEAYNKWIKPQKRSFVKLGEDTAEEWCE